jgi:hypothetical protein
MIIFLNICIYNMICIHISKEASVAEWLRSLTSNYLPLTAVGSTETLESFLWGSYPASLRIVGGSIQVPVRAWNNARKGTWGLPPPVKLEPMTYTVSLWRKTKNKQTYIKKMILPLPTRQVLSTQQVLLSDLIT